MSEDRPTLDEIRKDMRPFQKALLQEIWRHFRAKGDWPILRPLYSKHEKEKVTEALSALGGSVGSEQGVSGGWGKFQLTLLGVLLSGDGPELQVLLEHFLEFQRKLYRERPEAQNPSSDEIAKDLGLDSEKTTILGQLLCLATCGGSPGPKPAPWHTNAMAEAVDFPKTGSLSTQLEDWVLRFYERDTPAFQDQRRVHPMIISGTAGIEGNPLPPHPAEITNSLTRLRNKYPDANQLGFLIMRFTAARPFQRLVNIIKGTAEQHGLVVIRADENHFHADLWGNVRTLLHGCSFGIAIYERIKTNEPNANVGLEVGYLMAMNKPVMLLKDETLEALPSDLAGKLYVTFDPHDPENTIPDKLARWFEDNGITVPPRPVTEMTQAIYPTSSE